MKVMKLTRNDGVNFYNADFGPELVAETLRRCPNWKSIELVEMTQQEYFSISATSEAAQLWSGPTPRAADGLTCLCKLDDDGSIFDPLGCPIHDPARR